MVVDSVGGKTIVDSVKVLGWRGRLVSVGIAGRGGSAVNAFSLWAKDNTLHGVLFATSLQNEYPRSHALVGECLQRVASGELRVVIDRSFPLAEAAQAHAYNRRSPCVRPGGDDRVTAVARGRLAPVPRPDPLGAGRPARTCLLWPTLAAAVDRGRAGFQAGTC